MAILCNCFQQAEDAFAIFMDFLEHWYPMEIGTIWEYSNMVETSEGIRYIFTLYEFEKMFEEKGYDTIDCDRFFEDLENEEIFCV